MVNFISSVLCEWPDTSKFSIDFSQIDPPKVECCAIERNKSFSIAKVLRSRCISDILASSSMKTTLAWSSVVLYEILRVILFLATLNLFNQIFSSTLNDTDLSGVTTHDSTIPQNSSLLFQEASQYFDRSFFPSPSPSFSIFVLNLITSRGAVINFVESSAFANQSVPRN